MPEIDQLEVKSDLKLTIPIPANRHPATVYLSGLSAGSRPTMLHSLNAIASLLTNGECDALTLDWAALRYQHTAAVRGALRVRFALATAKKMLCALRRVLAEAKKLGLMATADYAQAVELPRIDTPPQPLRGRALNQSEIAAVMDVCQPVDSRPLDVRDLALIALLRGAGLRRSEVVHLKLVDFNPTTGAIEIRRSKRGSYRTVYLPTAAIPLVTPWLELRGSEPGPLLFPVRKGYRVHTSGV